MRAKEAVAVVIIGSRRSAQVARVLMVLAAAAGVMVQAATPVSATVDPTGYQGTYAGFSAANARAGGTLTCPAGRKAAAAGAYLPSSDGALTGLAPTQDGTGWYAAARLNSSTGSELTVFGLCVPTAQVAAASTIVLHDHRDRDTFHVQRSCPAGQLALAGGGFLHRPGQAPDPTDPAGAYGMYSLPTADGTGWEHTVSHSGSYGHRDYTFVLRCLPAADLPGSLGVSSVTAIPTGRTRGLTPVPVAGVARCPAGSSAYAGGGLFAKANGEPVGELSTSAPSFDGRSWQVTGIGPGGGTLVVRVRCVASPPMWTYQAPPRTSTLADQAS